MPISIALIVVPTVLWATLLQSWSDDIATLGAMVVVIVTLFVSCLAALLSAYYVEPGILPVVPANDEEATVPSGGLPNDRPRYVVEIGDKRYELQEKRAKFCRQTNSCVENFDHYCPWVGNAVGVRNYFFFVAFLTSAVLLCLAVGATACVRVMLDLQKDRSVEALLNSSATSGRAIVCFVLILYCAIVLLSVGGLWIFHMQLICSATTTNEAIKGVWNGRRNPHNRGCCGNCSRVWCSRRRPSYVMSDAGSAPLIINETRT